jgi:hypothetical protein
VFGRHRVADHPHHRVGLGVVGAGARRGLFVRQNVRSATGGQDKDTKSEQQAPDYEHARIFAHSGCA